MKNLLRRFSNISHIPDFQSFLISPSLISVEKKTLGGLKYYIQTYGCQMNENDSEIVSGILAGAGLGIAESPADVSHI